MSVSTKRGGTVQHGVLPPPGGNSCVVHGNGIGKKAFKTKNSCHLVQIILPTTKNMSYKVMGNGYTIAYRHKMAKVLLSFFKINLFFIF